MTNTNKLFTLAQLAEASYAELISAVNSQTNLINSLKDTKFSQTQAEEFAKNWKLISYQPNTESGFSATLFQYIGNDPNSGYTNGELVYAIRGTELGIFNPDDLASDIGDIVVDGLAVNQIVDMYNDWKRITAGTDQPYQAAILKTDLALTAQRALLPIGGTDAFDALLDSHLSGSDSAAIGGDLAYQYGKAGSLAGISVAAAQSVIADASSGQSAQSLQALASLQRAGQAKLMT